MEFDQLASMWWFVREFKKERKRTQKKNRKVSKRRKKILIKFWEVQCKKGILLWRRRLEKNNVERKFQKELTFRLILKTLLIFTFTHFYFIPCTFTLHYVLIKSLFDLEDCIVQYKYFWHPFMRLLVLFFIKHFSCDLYVKYLILLTLLHSHILLRVLHPISKWFHLLSDNTGTIWAEANFQIEIRVKFILKLRVCLGWLPLFTHIEFWWHVKFL